MHVYFVIRRTILFTHETLLLKLLIAIPFYTIHSKQVVNYAFFYIYFLSHPVDILALYALSYAVPLISYFHINFCFICSFRFSFCFQLQNFPFFISFFKFSDLEISQLNTNKTNTRMMSQVRSFTYIFIFCQKNSV